MSAAQDHQLHGRDQGRGERYEPRDASLRIILYSAAALFGCIAMSFVLVAVIIRLVGPAKEQRTESTLAPSPRLEVAEPADRVAIEARAHARLQGYGWADRAAGRVHIPIDRAMDLLAKQGWPDAATAGPPGQPDPAAASDRPQETGKMPGSATP